MAVDVARAKSLFLAASDLSDAAERAAYLGRECDGDAELRGRVEALLRANDSSPPPGSGDATRSHGSDIPAQTGDYGDPTASLGSVLAGRYKLIEEIGEGGMGSVYMAQQTEPVKRAVAVKVIKAGMDSKAVLARFEAERQALAMMDHPNIARVLDAGTTDGGRPFFVMELVKGTPITQFCDERKLTPRQRLELFVPVCQAIQHAHQKGVIHRDIKPSNVLVAMYDDRAVPKVIDFGVVKAAGQSLTDKTLMTGFGAVVGTPEYMSPEQANLNNLDVDTRSDVYSLGVLLYELLTGTTPVDRKSLGKAGMLEILRIVREVEAPRPSAKLSTIDTLPSVAANRGTEPGKLSRLMKGELDWVLLKALEKDRTRRYDTANGLARDVQRYLDDEVVEARPPSTGYRLKKFVRRHKGQVIAASLVLFALLAGMAGTTWGLIEAKRQEHEAKRQEQFARDETAEKEQARSDEAKRVTERDSALKLEAERAQERDQANNELKHRLGVSDLVLAAAAFDSRDVKLAAERLDKVPAEQRGWDWRYLKQQTRGGIFTLNGHRGPVTCVLFSPDGTRVATGAWDQHQPGEVKVWDARTGAMLLELKDRPNAPGIDSIVKSVAFSPDGRRIITSGENRTAKVRDAETGAVLLELKGHTTPVVGVAFSPDGTRIATGGDGQPRVLTRTGIEGRQGPGEVKVWDARTGKELLDLKGHSGSVVSVAFSPDGKRIATGGGDFGMPDELKVWDAEKGGKALFELTGIAGETSTVSFSPDGKWIVTGGRDGKTTVVNATTGAVEFKLEGRSREAHQTQMHSATIGTGVLGASFSPDGTRVVTGGGKGDVGEAIVWDVRTRRELVELKGHTNLVTGASFSPDGTRVVTGSADGTIRFWDARTGSGRLELGEQRGEVACVAFSPDGTRVATAGIDGTVKVWDVRTGGTPRELNGDKGPVRSVSFSGDGTRILTAGGGGELPGHATVWDAKTGAVLLELKGFKEGVLGAAFSPDGTRVVTGAFQDEPARGGTELKLWDARTGTVVFDLTEPRGEVFSPVARGWSVAFSPDGTRFVAGGGTDRTSLGGGIKVRDTRTGKVLLELKNEVTVLSVAFSPDGKRILAGDANKTAKVWDAGAGTPLLELKGHQGAVLSARFSPDGKRIVTGSYDKTVKVWDVRTGTALVELKGHTGPVQSVAFSPDGTRIVTGGGDAGKPGEAYVWDARVHTPALRLEHVGFVNKAAFSPDGTRIVTVDEKAGKVWDARTGELQIELAGFTGAAASVAFSLDGTRIVAGGHDKSTKVYDARTGQELPGEAVPKTFANEWTSPDGRFFAHVGVNRVELVPLEPDADELAYRRLHTRPNLGRYREGYLAARAARDDFAARFYLNLLPPADRTVLEAKADVDALTPLSQLAAEHLRFGRWDRALPLLAEIANVKKAKLGPEDPETLEAMIQLGVVHFRMGQFDKAVLVFEEVWKTREKNLGGHHPQTLAAGANLGVNYQMVGRLREAIPLLEKAHRAAKEYPELGWVAGELIGTYEAAGETDKATHLLLEQVPLAREQLPRDSPQLGGFLAVTGMSLLRMNKWVEAEPLLRESLAIRNKTQPENWATFNTQSMLGGALLGQKRYAEAEPLLLAGYEGMKQREKTIPPQGRVRLPEALDRLIESSTATSKPDDARKWRAERAKYPAEQAPPPRAKK